MSRAGMTTHCGRAGALRRGSACNLWIAFRQQVRTYGRAPPHKTRPEVRTFWEDCKLALSSAQEASAFCLSWSNSAWVIAPLSSRLFADAIWSAGLLLP